MANYQKISDVRPSMVWRLSTCEKEIDWLYGASRWTKGKPPIKDYRYGLPVGKISIWSGEGGVGKSRLAIHIAKKIADKHENNTVLYFQNEVDIPTFASWVNDRKKNNFYCSNSTSLSEQIKIIREIKPDLVIVDSINLIDEFGNGADSKVKSIMDAYREVIKKTNDEEKHRNKITSSHAHIIFLCQLSKDGSSKGSTALTHLPDTTVVITKQDECFKVAIGDKHRYGRTSSDLFTLWKHIDTGVECISNNKMKDPQWCKDYSWRKDLFPDPVPKPMLAPKSLIKCSTSRYMALKQLYGDPYKTHIIDPACDRIFDDINEPKELTFWEKVKRDTFRL